MNKAFLIGNLTRDPETRDVNGKTVASFGIAVNRNYTAQDGTRPVDFFNITVWGRSAENCAKFLAKGRKVCVVGAIQIRNYDAQDGTKRTSVDIQAEEVQFLSAKGEGEGLGTDFDQIETLPEVKSGAKKATPIEKIMPAEDDLPF